MGKSDLPEIYALALGHTAPECSCVYFRQIKSAHVITNISHSPCRLIAYYGWPKAVQATNLLYSQPWEIWLWVSSKDIVATCINMNGRKQADIMKIMESWNKWFYNCFMAVTLFKNCFTQFNKDLKALISL